MNPQQQQRKQLRQLFEENKQGYLWLSQLKKIAPSNLMITEIAHHYDYVPVYKNKTSAKIIAYKHRTLNHDIL